MANIIPLEATATTTEDTTAVPIRHVIHLTNDGAADIIFAFESSTTSGAAFTLKPGESITDENITFGSISYRATTGTQAFRLLGKA